MARRKPQPPGTVNVGRKTSGGVHGGLFGNPFVVGGTAPLDDGSRVHLPDAGSTLPHYERYLWMRIENQPWYAALFEELRGQTLWCPGCGVGAEHCHARVIEKVLAQQLVMRAEAKKRWDAMDADVPRGTCGEGTEGQRDKGTE